MLANASPRKPDVSTKVRAMCFSELIVAESNDQINNKNSHGRHARNFYEPPIDDHKGGDGTQKADF